MSGSSLVNDRLRTESQYQETLEQVALHVDEEFHDQFFEVRGASLKVCDGLSCSARRVEEVGWAWRREGEAKVHKPKV